MSRASYFAGVLLYGSCSLTLAFGATADSSLTEYRLSTSLQRVQDRIIENGTQRKSSISSIFAGIRGKEQSYVEETQQIQAVPRQEPVKTVSCTVASPAVAARTIKANVTGPVLPKSSCHTIAPGETLASISRKYYGTSKAWKMLAKENGIVDASAISVGAKLFIPSNPDKPEESRIETVPITVQKPVQYVNRYTAPSEQPLDYDNYEWKVYQSKHGETLSDLAGKFLGDRTKKTVLARYNKLPSNAVLPHNYTLLVPQKKRSAITERYILSTQGVFK